MINTDKLADNIYPIGFRYFGERDFIAEHSVVILEVIHVSLRDIIF